MPFNPEKPRTEDREFHPEQSNLNEVTSKLASIETRQNLAEFPDDNAKETFIRSLDVVEEHINNIRKQIG